MTARVELVTTAGIFSLDGEDFEVENNIWIIGDDDEVLVVDAAHDAAPIAEAVGGRHGRGDRVHARPQRPHQRRRRRWPRASAGLRCCCIPLTGCSGTWSIPGDPPDGTLADGDRVHVGSHRAHRPAHPWAQPGRDLPP